MIAKHIALSTIWRFRVHSFGRIQIRISDLWRSFWANPFSDQWSIKSNLDKDSLDHWSAWSKDGSSNHWSNLFLWVKDPKLIILPIAAQFQTSTVGTSYIDQKDCLQSLHKFCNKHKIKSICHWSQAFRVLKYPYRNQYLLLFSFHRLSLPLKKCASDE